MRRVRRWPTKSPVFKAPRKSWRKSWASLGSPTRTPSIVYRWTSRPSGRRWSDGKTAQISPFDRDLIILAAPAEIPERLVGYLKKHKLLWVRVTARDHWTYRMVGANNHAELRAVIVESQSCDVIFTVKSGKVTASERKPSLDESQTHLCVGRRRLPLDEVEQMAEWQQFS